MTKHRDCRPFHRGFTLLEMSIVLVIIGLLVGVVAGMRSYVRNAQLNTMMNETKYYINAYNQFQTRYNAPPGDYCTPGTTCGSNGSNTVGGTWTGAYNGDGNGVIGSTAFPNERYYAFQHLALAGYIQGAYTGLPSNGASGFTAGVNIPASSMDTVVYLFDHPNQLDGALSGDATFSDGMYGNILWVAGMQTYSSTIPNLPFLSPIDMHKLDTKYDDGLPLSGGMQVPKTLINCADHSVYNPDTTSNQCYFFIKVQ